MGEMALGEMGIHPLSRVLWFLKIYSHFIISDPIGYEF
jgi:hypothetical protein